MECQNAQSLMDGYLDGELDAARNLEIQSHLQSCSRCSRAFEDRQVLHDAFKTGDLYFKAPAELQSRIQRSVRQASKSEYAPRKLWSPWAWIAAPLAAVAIAVLAIVPLLRRPSSEEILTQEIIASHVRSLMASHLVDVTSSDTHTVKPWFNGKLDFSPPVVDLANEGFRLAGGRLDYLNNRPVAALIYQRDKHFINVFIWPSESKPADTTAVTRQGYNLVHWNGSGMTFWAVSDVERIQLEKFVSILKSQLPNPS